MVRVARGSAPEPGGAAFLRGLPDRSCHTRRSLTRFVDVPPFGTGVPTRLLPLEARSPPPSTLPPCRDSPARHFAGRRVAVRRPPVAEGSGFAQGGPTEGRP